MTTLREAAQQALEAMLNFPDDISDDMFESITALKAALVEDAMQKFTDVNQELEAALAETQTWVCPDSAEHRYGKPGHCEDCGKTLVQVAEPMQEGCEHCNSPLYAAVKCRVCGRVTSAEPVQEPVAWSYELATTMLEHGYDGWEHRITRYKPNVPEGSIRNLTPLFAASPQRKPLTDDQLDDIAVAARRGNLYDLRIAIERAHGIT